MIIVLVALAIAAAPVRAEQIKVADDPVLVSDQTQMFPDGDSVVNQSVPGDVRGAWNRTAGGIVKTDGERVYDVLALWDRFPKVLVPLGGDERCRNATLLYLRALRNFDLWALKMFDATAKLPSGILSGNINQYGDFDECLSVGAGRGEGAVRGQYCLASVQLERTLAHLDTMIHAHHYIRSNITDMGHRVPRFSSVLWGVCVPAACGARDLQRGLARHLAGGGGGGGGVARVRIDPAMCAAAERVSAVPPLAKTVVVALFLGILSLLVLGTLLDDDTVGESKYTKILHCFSLRRNVRRLLDTRPSAQEVSAVNGVRCLNALALLMAHKSMAMTHAPFVNRTQMAELLAEPWTVIGRTAIIYTDTFLYLSGLLNAYHLLREFDAKGSIDFRSRIVSRWFRIFPLFFSLMLFCTYVLPDLGAGPQWGLVVEEHSRVCRRTMWRSVLFLHNFFGFENMCLTHTHQLGLDMQLYLVTPLFVWALRRLPRLGWALLLGSAAMSTLLRYLAVYRHNISMVVYFGISVQNLLDAAKYSYILPTHRATIYLMGVAMACLLLSKRIFQLSKAQTYMLWTTALASGLWAQLSPWRMGLRSYSYEQDPAALYAAASPLAWGAFLCLAHWAICTGHGGWFTRFLDSRVFRFLNKISYGVYLVQFPLYFYNVGVQRHSGYYSTLHVLYLPELVAILALATLTTVAIEMPFCEIHRTFFSKPNLRQSTDKVKVK